MKKNKTTEIPHNYNKDFKYYHSVSYGIKTEEGVATETKVEILFYFYKNSITVKSENIDFWNNNLNILESLFVAKNLNKLDEIMDVYKIEMNNSRSELGFINNVSPKLNFDKLKKDIALILLN